MRTRRQEQAIKGGGGGEEAHQSSGCFVMPCTLRSSGGGILEAQGDECGLHTRGYKLVDVLSLDDSFQAVQGIESKRKGGRRDEGSHGVTKQAACRALAMAISGLATWHMCVWRAGSVTS